MNDSDIIHKIERQPKQAASFKQLVRELGARGFEARRDLSDRLDRLVRRGQLAQIGPGRFAIPPAPRRANAAAGRLSMHRDGYGFVIPESQELKQRISGDIYVPPHAICNAMHGDRVLVEVGTVRPDGRAEGRILRVLGRAHPTVVGVFHYGSKFNYVTPMDEKITQDIMIPRGLEWPEAPTAESEARPATRHRVIGDEARRRTAGGGAAGQREDLEGVIVDVEITDWPTPTQNPRGRVIEVLGNEDDFGVDVEIVIRKHHLPHRFAPEVLEEAEAAAAQDIVPAGEQRHRRDFRHLPIVTIDGETARDFDDAVYVRRLPHGGYELQVHIADVAHYVRPGSELDREARLRGTSVYFPDRAVPMLPIELSTDVCSLRPHAERLVLSCLMTIDPRGEITGFELSEGVIRSAERMTYTDVNALLEDDAALRQRYAPLVPTFELMRDLAAILNRKRERRGSLDFDLPEPVIQFDEFGLMRAISRSERNVAHRLIEEFMLAANECVASYLETRQVPSLYRVHEKPDPKKVFEFEQIAAAFGYSLGVGALPVRRFTPRGDRRERYGSGRRPQAIEVPQDVHIAPQMYQKLTQKIAGKPEERIVAYLVLRSLKQARYSEESLGHFALAAPSYTHFTSPIRRYPDLIVHRILKQVLRDTAESQDGEVPVGRGVPVSRPYRPDVPAKHPSQSKSKRSSGDGHARGRIALEELRDIADESSQAERRADDAERELLDWKKVRFMRDRIGEEFEGLIISVTRFGIFVELMELFVEGLVPIATLTGDRFTFRENTRQIIGERSRKVYSLGDRVRVWVDRIDPVQKKIQFALAEEPVPAQKKHARSRRS